jgi:beta-galactosidase
MGYNGVSFYSAWVLHEPKPGSFKAEGLFDWEPYFEAAKQAGIYLVAVNIPTIK